ncbi:MAG: hypothetical protein JXX29_15950 [Deltaproteobacteria bacterium]|nr:hypothetical protein [Deltaproteobacteria bacterium]MBN2673175.1 hypothetical protein [Deltaproteobacteria bacterium]
MKPQWVYLLLMLLIAISACDVTDVDGSALNVTFSLPTSDMTSSANPPRYAVIWMGNSVWKVTADGPIPSGATQVNIPIQLPPRHLLEKVQPAETLTYAYYYFPEAPMRRPRIVVYDDTNLNQQFDLLTDQILALDGFGQDYYATIMAFLDLDQFLSSLSIEETQVYYDWTFNKYSKVMFGVADPDWSDFVMPLFEGSSETEIAHVQPVLELQAGNPLLMEKDILCFRHVEEAHDSIYEQIWVDDTLDVEFICSDTTVPCDGFDASIAPDFEAMAAQSQVFSSSCGWGNPLYQPFGASMGTVTCNGCHCEYTHHVITYYLNASALPEWIPCGGQTLSSSLK